MELLNKFPKGFFTVPCNTLKPSKNPDDKIVPIKWKSNNGNKKIIVKSVKEKNK